MILRTFELPLISAIAHLSSPILDVVVQGHRFNIAEEIGCLPAIFVTPLTFPLLFIWPVLIGLVSFIYAGTHSCLFWLYGKLNNFIALTLRAFWRRRIQFQELLSSASSMSISRYFRLMLLSFLEMVLTIPLAVYSIYINTNGVPVAPYKSWADTHYQFWVVLQIPAFIWQGNQANAIAVEMGRWIYPCAAFLFFALFGFAEEARRHYRAAFWWVVRPLSLKPRPKKIAFHNASRCVSSVPSSFRHSSSAIALATPTLSKARSRQRAWTTSYRRTPVLARKPFDNIPSPLRDPSPNLTRSTSRNWLTRPRSTTRALSTFGAVCQKRAPKIRTALSSLMQSTSTQASSTSLSRPLRLLPRA